MTSALQADVAIIGSGIAGALAATVLARQGVNVLILEAGATVDRSQAVQSFWRAAVKVPECVGPPVPQAMHPVTDPPDGWYRQQGPESCKSTVRMAADAATSVVDGRLCSHDHRNLYLLGSGVFPTGGTANPGLTLAALSLRAAQAMADRTQAG